MIISTESSQKVPLPVPSDGQPSEEGEDLATMVGQEQDLATMVGQLNQLRCSGVEAPRDQRLDMAERVSVMAS